MILYIIIIFTGVFSFLALQQREIMNRFIMWPYAVKHNNEWWRFITSGFLHADFTHLFFNMFVLYSFGQALVSYFGFLFGNLYVYYFLILYIGAIIISDLSSYIKYHESPSYRSLGASGAVSAVLFAFILLNPTSKVYVFFLLPLPGFVWGLIYLGYSWYMAKQGGDRINHDAHFYGAVFGFLFPIMLRPNLFMDFVDQIKTLL